MSKRSWLWACLAILSLSIAVVGGGCDDSGSGELPRKDTNVDGADGLLDVSDATDSADADAVADSSVDTGTDQDSGIDGSDADAGDHCTNGVVDGDETDVDCGGPTCPACSDGAACQVRNDCESEICRNELCAAFDCQDAVLNGEETDVDCGGNDCPACPDGDDCAAADDCESGICSGDVCVAFDCADQIQNGNETDVDCGGADCDPCPVDSSCAEAGDCESGICSSSTCVAFDCSDQIQNGNETDVDCGGADCPQCPNSSACMVSTDCESGICSGGFCVTMDCTNGTQDGDETDVDCGGPDCGPCADDSACMLADDCQSGICSANVCVAFDCSDGIQNGNETGVDCGGSDCTDTCPNGSGCVDNTDCTSGICSGGTCSAFDCSNGVQDGNETDVDCGGADCPACSDGDTCSAAADCSSGICSSNTCVAFDCNDGQTNGSETDVDCGGSDCPACGDGDACGADADCESQVCSGGTCASASCTDGVQNGTETGTDCGGSCPGCGDGDACTTSADCAVGFCVSQTCTRTGDGSDGALTAATDTTINTTIASITAPQGSTTATIFNVNGTFASGDVVLLHQTVYSGAVEEAGVFEFAEISGVSAGQLTFAAPLRNGYSTISPNKAQVIRVPQYTDVTVEAAATLSAPAWDGNQGGILVFLASGTVTVDGTIDMNGAGYLGRNHTCVYQCGHGFQGTSWLGQGTEDVTANGSGGGGGSLGQDCASGGGGGHAVDGQAGGDGTCGGGCGPTSCVGGEGGLASGDDLSSRILFGGAGGEGGADEDGAVPGAGGNGGGIVLFRASDVVVTGAISADGLDGARGDNVQAGCSSGVGAGMGGGGGGAGGAIAIFAEGAVDVGDQLVTAYGGVGGQCDSSLATFGGTGASGLVGVTASSVTGATAPHPGDLLAPHCFDGVVSGNESDVDCGGRCGRCGPTLACTVASDCQTGSCSSGTCAAPFSTCLALLDAEPTTPDGTYLLDVDAGGPLSPMWAQCDMTTEGGGWMLVLNYLHQSGTNPPLSVLSDRLPLLGSSSLGVDESWSTDYWGHAGNALMSAISFEQTMWFGATSSHNRVIHFMNESTVVADYIRTGTGNMVPEIFTSPGTRSLAKRANSTLPLHTAPNDLRGWSGQGDLAMTAFPFYGNSAIENPRAHWGVRGGGSRWEMDNSSSADTHHQVWVRPAPCADGTQNIDESDVDCGGSCGNCADGSTCNSDSDCLSGTCDSGTCSGASLERNCNDLLTAHPGLEDGVYTVDPDGMGGFAALDVYCDMTFDGGGWTLVVSTANGDGPDATSEDTVLPGTSTHMPTAPLQAISAASTQTHVRTMDEAGNRSVTSVSGSAPINNLTNLNVLVPNGTYDLTEWSGPFADDAHLQVSCDTSTAAYPDVYWACGTSTGLHLLEGNSRWVSSPGVGLNEPMQLYVR